jgi:hypothetical protein
MDRWADTLLMGRYITEAGEITFSSGKFQSTTPSIAEPVFQLEGDKTICEMPLA